MRYQAVLASPEGHVSSDMLPSFDVAVEWAFDRMTHHTVFVYGVVGYRITEVYVLTDGKWRYISC